MFRILFLLNSTKSRWLSAIIHRVFVLDDRKGGLYISPRGPGVNNTPMSTTMALPKRAGQTRICLADGNVYRDDFRKSCDLVASVIFFKQGAAFAKILILIDLFDATKNANVWLVFRYQQTPPTLL